MSSARGCGGIQFRMPTIIQPVVNTSVLRSTVHYIKLYTVGLTDRGFLPTKIQSRIHSSACIIHLHGSFALYYLFFQFSHAAWNVYNKCDNQFMLEHLPLFVKLSTQQTRPSTSADYKPYNFFSNMIFHTTQHMYHERKSWKIRKCERRPCQ